MRAAPPFAFELLSPLLCAADPFPSTSLTRRRIAVSWRVHAFVTLGAPLAPDVHTSRFVCPFPLIPFPPLTPTLRALHATRAPFLPLPRRLSPSRSQYHNPRFALAFFSLPGPLSAQSHTHADLSSPPHSCLSLSLFHSLLLSISLILLSPSLAPLPLSPPSTSISSHAYIMISRSTPLPVHSLKLKTHVHSCMNEVDRQQLQGASRTHWNAAGAKPTAAAGERLRSRLIGVGLLLELFRLVDVQEGAIAVE